MYKVTQWYANLLFRPEILAETVKAGVLKKSGESNNTALFQSDPHIMCSEIV